MSHSFSSTCGQNISPNCQILLCKQLFLVRKQWALKVTFWTIKSSLMGSYFAHRQRRMNVTYSSSCKIFLLFKIKRKGIFLSAKRHLQRKKLLRKTLQSDAYRSVERTQYIQESTDLQIDQLQPALQRYLQKGHTKARCSI